MITIAVTGGMGAGKTETTKMLEVLGATVIRADELAHRSYAPGTIAHGEIVRVFGAAVLDPDGNVDRAKLGGIVFGDRRQRERLESIVWHETRRMMVESLARHYRSHERVVVIEAAVLFEAGWHDLADTVITVEAPEDIRVARLRSRTGLSEDEIRSRFAAQLSSTERIERADQVICNDGDLTQLNGYVSSIWRQLTQ